MSNLTVKCPCCHEEFPLSGDLLTSVRAELSESITAQVKEREEELAQKQKQFQTKEEELKARQIASEKEIAQKVAQQIASREKHLQEEASKISDLKETLLKERTNLQESINEKVSKELKVKEATFIQQAEAKAQQEAELKIKEKDALLTQQEEALKHAKQKELVFLKQEQVLKDKEADIELTIARKLKEQSTQIAESARAKSDEEHLLRVAEKEKTISELQQKLQEAVRKAELGSQQGQGEVFELQLEEYLRQNYPLDTVASIKTGANGADISLFVESQSATDGKHILFELKNTNNWQPKWITKLKDDMQVSNANLGLIISRALPPEIKGFGLMNGVWICDLQSAKSLIVTLRAYLIELHRTRNLQEGAKDKAQQIYDYITSDNFRQRVSQISEHFQHLRDEMHAERTYMERKWAKRESHIQTILGNLNGITGTTEALTETTIAIEETK